MSSNIYRPHDTPRPSITPSYLEDINFAELSKAYRDNIVSREDSLIKNAAQHEHNQRVPACTIDQPGGQHNKNCGSGLNVSLWEYNYLCSLGLIPERPLHEWGCDNVSRNTEAQEAEEPKDEEIEDGQQKDDEQEVDKQEEQEPKNENMKIKMAFRPINWCQGFTGRGSEFDIYFMPHQFMLMRI